MIKYLKGDLFKQCASNSVLAHSCNPLGHWGGGIALQFKKRFPNAEKQYVEHCEKYASNPSKLLGTCLLVRDVDAAHNNDERIIACLFTSDFNNSIKEILQYTVKAVEQMEHQLLSLNNDDYKLVEMPKINSGIFCTPWELTEEILKKSCLNYNVYVL